MSKHLRVLKEAGLVEVHPDAQRRLYRLRPEPLSELDAWLAPYRRFWEQHLDALERRLVHPPEKVWRALTEREHLSQWYPFSAMEIDLRSGGTIRFDDGEGSTLEAVITEFDPPRVFAFRTPAGEVLDREGDNLLHFELHPDDEGCLLVFTHTFDDGPAAASYAAGWQLCLDALEMVLEGRPIEWGSPPAELHEAFVEKFGLDVGSSEDTPEGWLVRFDRQFMGSTIDQVWATLNDSGSSAPTQEASWPLAGGPVPQAFTTEEVPPRAVTGYNPPVLLEYEWLFEGRPAGRVRWELSHGPGGARLTLTQTGPGELPPNGPPPWRAGRHASNVSPGGCRVRLVECWRTVAPARSKRLILSAKPVCWC